MAIRIASAAILVSSLVGCVAMTPQEIRATTPEIYDSSASADSALKCARTNADYIQVTTYPESGTVELTVETFQLMKTRVLYMAILERLQDGTRVSARYSGQNSISVSESEFRNLLTTCAPPRTH